MLGGEERERAVTRQMIRSSPLTRKMSRPTLNVTQHQQAGKSWRLNLWFLSQLEHKTCDILAAERLRLLRFDNRLIIDFFQKAIYVYTQMVVFHK